jgi:hypothetical protein
MSSRPSGGERLEAVGAGRGRLRRQDVGDDDEQEVRPGRRAAHLREVGGVRHDGPRAAVGEDVREFLVRGPGVDGHADGRGAEGGEVTLDGLDAVAEEEHQPVPGRDPEGGQVSGDPGGAPLQGRVGE